MRSVRVISFIFSILTILTLDIRATGEPTSPADLTTNALGTVLCDHLIGQDVSIANGRTNYANVSPGDTVCIKAGVRNYLILRNFSGTAEKPITFINSGGQVVIDSTNSGIAIQNSRHFHLTGTGSADTYGIKIIRSAGHGIFVRLKSSDFEIDHIEIANVTKVGILSADQTTCSDGSTNKYDFDDDGQIKGDRDDVLNRASFTQTNTVYRHNYIHDVGTEGFYLGSSFYAREKQMECVAGPETRYDPVLVGVQLFNNRLENTGWDGIQVGSAVESCHIHHNQVSWSGQASQSSQQNGIMNNPGSVCNIYNNFVWGGTGTGIFIQGNGNNRVYNNVLVNPGQDGDAGNGISVVTGSNPGNSIYVWNNIIVAPKRYGIAYSNSKGTDNKIQNNFIVAPGNDAAKGKNAYIRIWGRGNVTESHNVFR